jgi:hypothetical protein
MLVLRMGSEAQVLAAVVKTVIVSVIHLKVGGCGEYLPVHEHRALRRSISRGLPRRIVFFPMAVPFSEPLVLS